MKRTVWTLTLVAVVLVAAAGCKKKAPMTVAETVVETPPTAVREAPPPPAPEPQAAFDPWSGDLDSINAYIREHGLMADVYFDFDRSDLRPDTRERLAKNARFLAEHPEFVIAIEGHCDERGTNDYNLALGQTRAYTTRDYLNRLGTSDTRLKTVSYGKERPLCTDPAESCWWQNRRAAFVVVGRTGAG